MSDPGTYSGASLDEALSRACGALRCRLGELWYEVAAGSGGEPVEIRAAVDPIAVVGLFLSETFRAGQLEVTARLTATDEALNGELTGADLGLLVGSGGRGLDALQYLCNRVLTGRLGSHPPVHLDTNGFKDRRARQLRDRALAAAAEVTDRGTPVVLGPLTPAARREIHLALADHPDVETSSDGDGFLKRLVVRPRRRR